MVYAFGRCVDGSENVSQWYTRSAGAWIDLRMLASGIRVRQVHGWI